MAADIWKLIKPLLRWAGGKRTLAPSICNLIPVSFWTSEGRYFEPFVGGAAVSIEVAIRRKSSQGLYLSDANEDLVNLYKMVQSEPENLIAYISNQEFSNSSECYYRVRSAVREDPIARAARTLYLNATCFNGLYRTNASGGFNVPFGKLKSPDFHKSKQILELSQLFKDATFTVENFDAFIEKWVPGTRDIVYFDPPYIPLSATSSFTSYAKDGFATEEQKHLSSVIKNLVSNGVSVILSNSYTPLTMEIFADTGLKFFKVKMSRSISANAGSRKPVYEILATNISGVDIPENLEVID